MCHTSFLKNNFIFFFVLFFCINSVGISSNLNVLESRKKKCLDAVWLLCVGKDVEEFYVKLILNSLKVKRAEWANLMSLSSQKIWANLKTSNNHTNKFLSILKKGLPNWFPCRLFFSSMIYRFNVVFQCFISTHYQVLFVLVSTSQ